MYFEKQNIKEKESTHMFGRRMVTIKLFAFAVTIRTAIHRRISMNYIQLYHQKDSNKFECVNKLFQSIFNVALGSTKFIS